MNLDTKKLQINPKISWEIDYMFNFIKKHHFRQTVPS